MKKSKSYLPKCKLENLTSWFRNINKRLLQAEMIILYGGYSTGKFVEYDEHVEFCILTSFISYYDILVVTNRVPNNKAGNELNIIEGIYYKDTDNKTTVQFANYDIKSLKHQLEAGRYLYTQLKQEGSILYNSKKNKLSRRRKLNFIEIQQKALEYFGEKIESVQNKLIMAQFAFKNGLYKEAIFNLQQVSENIYFAISFAFILTSSKLYNLTKLSGSVKYHFEELATVFPGSTAEEKQLFPFLKDTYVVAFNNYNFLVTKKDIDAISHKVELLRDFKKKYLRAENL